MIVTTDGIVDGSLAARSPRIVPDGRTFWYVLHEAEGPGSPRIVITQNDVRAIQLAKAALYAGVRLLMDHLGIEEVDEIRLAGAFGSQIDLLHAMVLGLMPDCDLAQAGPAGNAAGTGALIALLSGAARREIETVVRQVEKIETAVEPRFQQHFVEAMAFPHKTAPMPHLALAVELPAGRSVAGGRRRETRRRQRTTPATRGRRPGHGGPLMESPHGRRAGGRAGRVALRASQHEQVERLPFLTRSFTPFEILNDEGLSIIEANADTILQEVGLEFRGDADALRLFREAGADVQGERVRFPRGMARQIVQATAPAQFVQEARNPSRSVRIGGPHTVLAPVVRHAVRARPRQRPALRHDRGLPQLREARLREPVPPPLRRHGLRAGRRAGEQAPPRHGLQPHDATRTSRSWAR